MRTFLIGLMSLLCTINTYAQSQDGFTYIILTSKPFVSDAQSTKGIFRYVSKTQNTLYKSPSIGFILLDKGRLGEQWLKYYDYDIEKLRATRARIHNDVAVENLIKPKDIMDIKVMPVAFLDTIHPIDLDALFPTFTRESCNTLFESFRDKRLYIIDRNDITDTTVTLIGAVLVTPRPF